MPNISFDKFSFLYRQEWIIIGCLYDIGYGKRLSHDPVYLHLLACSGIYTAIIFFLIYFFCEYLIGYMIAFDCALIHQK
jgi:cytochrome bd-type quinol oxidase subunit 1